MNDVFRLNDRITLLPVIHGSGDFAIEVRRVMLEQSFDLLAVPLPPSFQVDVEDAIGSLPTPTVVVQTIPAEEMLWSPDHDSDVDDEYGHTNHTLTYVPVDPCQAVINAIRFAISERMPRAFIDRESRLFSARATHTPDPYALKKVRADRFASAILPVLPRLTETDEIDRVRHMAGQLHELSDQASHILCLCSMGDWPWIREAFLSRDVPQAVADQPGPTEILQPGPKSLLFMLGELPFITALYERARMQLNDDENLAVDGIKELLVAARGSYQADYRSFARRITPHLLSVCLKYVRNLTLLDRRFTPDLYNLVMAAKQVVSDGFALHVAERAKEYEFAELTVHRSVDFGVDRLRLPDGEIVQHSNRLPGPPVVWRSCQLIPQPPKTDRRKWEMAWNPFSQCSWPPEDNKIEDFRTHVSDRAKAVLGLDLAKTEKFTTSLKDGLDIRDTLRNWHTGDLYVKVLPPSKGRLDAVVMLFESPVDPRDYSWRTTWFAEHQNESTLAFFATDFRQQMVGPGIGMAHYGGAMFLFPPVAIDDIWQDPRLDFATTLEERLLAAACLHSQCPHIALLAPGPPGTGWRRLAKRFGKKWVHLPISSFSQSTIAQLRIVHVLNGHEIRSYASHFIRKA